MKILIISYDFPPFNTIGAVRVGKMAKYLCKFGHDVRVITAGDQPLPSTLKVEIPPQNITYTNWVNFSKIAKFIFPKIRPQKKVNETLERSKKLIKYNFLDKLLFLYRNCVYFPDAKIGWLPFAISATSRLIEENWKPDLIYASAVPFTSLMVARFLSLKYGIPWVGELRDLWVDNHFYDIFHSKGRKMLEEHLERWILSHANGLVTVSKPHADILNKKYRKPVAVILNGFDREDYPTNEKKEVPLLSSICIVYTGTIYAGETFQNRQDPTPLFQSVDKLARSGKHIELLFYANNPNSIKEMALQNHIEHLVKTPERVSYKKSLQIQTQADILLLLLWNDPQERGVYTGKLFEYIGAGRPILAIGHSDNVAAELIRERKAGVVLNDPDAIAEQIRLWIHQKQTMGQIPSLPANVGVGLSREEQARKLENFMGDILKL
ncbi:glycosyltransferase family 4 protein [Laspinema olomoucense]|uniref:glycosyltransferase family 4 protein n=1 Tax=Laspinema olomoucense TaxID=3231600 RepID=UPI0021BB5329|nr:glycosyltransferase family 4 protein [Laspinema sp. D3c]MCT7994527.1 glycosyltransferase family 4 protein [Laspinema sp. D3c]